ncbi:MAG: glycogen synthase GlgA [Candidatus Acetothermia bacterium]|nr:glycogen synthase GlgA [Candidatus Acetothermia bacterium]MDH7505877.1 glycogen synthase GlgA [Candidatus Acetothermia bacterium]
MKVLMVAAEAAPFAKTGGLADVLGALPKALHQLGLEVSILLPRYRGIPPGEPFASFTARIGGKAVEGQIERTILPGSAVPVFLAVNEHYYGRAGLYGEEGRDYPDNAERFAFLAQAALELARSVRPKIIHAHDWHTALIPVYLKTIHQDLGRIKTVYTIHNLAYQGEFDRSAFRVLGLEERPELVVRGKLNWMKGGILFSDLLTTVSERYAQEIQTPEFGNGLHEELRSRAGELFGIAHGVDYDEWNPSTDRWIIRNYDWDSLEGKKENKLYLQRLNGLREDPEIPLLGSVARLVEQKGFDLIAAALDEIIKLGAQYVLLGTGEPRFHQLFWDLAERHRGWVGVNLGYSDKLAHQIEAGADIFLMPSRFEPCGLNQLYSLRYGTVPIVRATGGLDDTIRDYSDGQGNGFKFKEYTVEALLGAVRRTLALYEDKKAWCALQARIMQEDHSWLQAARKYLQLYERLVKS